MKKQHNLFLIILITIIGLQGCTPPPEIPLNTSKVLDVNSTHYGIYEYQHKGHSYIVADLATGVSMIHAAHCTCKPINP